MKQKINVNKKKPEGLLLIDKPINKSSFYLVSFLRALCNVKKIGHTGTLDPIASGLMLLLIGKQYTTKASLFLNARKSYHATIKLSQSTNTYDSEGQITNTSTIIPTLDQINHCLEGFNGDQVQVPPMFSAKKVQGKKLYELARKNIEIKREPTPINLNINLINYQYPLLSINVDCSSGTYIRTLAHDIGLSLKTFGHIVALKRTKNDKYCLENAVTIDQMQESSFNIHQHLLTL